MTRGTDYIIKIPDASPWFQVHVSVIIIIAAFLALLAVRSLDLNVYHRMLRGAVTFGEDFEEQYMKEIFNLDKGMTQTISHYSRYSDADKDNDPANNRYKYKGECKKSAELKIRSFYKLTLAFLLSSALAIFLTTNLNIWIADKSVSQSRVKTSTFSETNSSNSLIKDTIESMGKTMQKKSAESSEEKIGK